VQDIKTKHIVEGDRLIKRLAKIVQNNPKIAQTFIYQGAEHDYLYKSTYSYTRGETYNRYDIRQTVYREFRTTTDPHIYYSNIASSNKVIKNS
jgi:hypothetical protein